MNNSTEFALLLKSHSAERAKELLSQRYSIFGGQKPFLVLHDAAAPAKPARRRSRKGVTSAALKEFKETFDPDMYPQFVALNELWLSYINNVLGDAAKRDAVTAAQKLLTADWHGARIRITAARNPSLVGKAGILLWEGRSMMLIVTPKRQLKQVTKAGTVFQLQGVTPSIELAGSRLLVRSTERTTRKFKPHDVHDIAPLLDL
ncbi:Ribonuclease P protein subunit p29 [Wickerhamiella sorbophila]|uniref:Ribonuclease P protein subunit p29 n=1 Tax=Wickerhamiella sorbophila TaxID=45607 RepID=A0A2T0FGN9_9ASCO|nr:Ribonuclease P protein subunit p29 [Wickerhamiella sorbophila]PRT54127.1 Ribonuclease P protein subunit p29 [Wickerhamiella sorbophila]